MVRNGVVRRALMGAFVVATFGLVLALMPRPASAQATTGTLAGSVKDVQGAPRRCGRCRCKCASRFEDEYVCGDSNPWKCTDFRD